MSRPGFLLKKPNGFSVKPAAHTSKGKERCMSL
jgi:hypothetical protein